MRVVLVLIAVLPITVLCSLMWTVVARGRKLAVRALADTRARGVREGGRCDRARLVAGRGDAVVRDEVKRESEFVVDRPVRGDRHVGSVLPGVSAGVVDQDGHTRVAAPAPPSEPDQRARPVAHLPT